MAIFGRHPETSTTGARGIDCSYQRIISPTPPTALQCIELATTIQEEIELLGCSDSFYVEDTGTSYHGWIFSSDISKTIAEGSGPGHGHPDLFSSYSCYVVS
jgi:hypothetical protein